VVLHKQGFFVDQKDDQIGIGLHDLYSLTDEQVCRIADLLSQLREQPGDVTFSYGMTFLCLEFYHGSAGDISL
jgi:hypothetical protein